MPIERAMGLYQNNVKNYGETQIMGPRWRNLFLAWSFPNCFLAQSVILVERFQLPNPNPNP